MANELPHDLFAFWYVDETSSYRRDLYSEFVSQHPFSSSAQTLAWGRFQEDAPGRGPSWACLVQEEDRPVGSFQVIQHQMARGLCFLWCQDGPLFTPDRPDVLRAILGELKNIAKKQGAVFVRLDPLIPVTGFSAADSAREGSDFTEEDLNRARAYFGARGLKTAHVQFRPLATLRLDLRRGSDELLGAVKPKTRYNIRLAERRNVRVESHSEPNQEIIEEFLEIQAETMGRHGLRELPDAYYRRLIETLAPTGILRLHLARFEGQALATLLALHFGGVCAHLYGGSLRRLRERKAPSLVVWKSILRAKEEGLMRYDFGGISPGPYRAESTGWRLRDCATDQCFNEEGKAKEFLLTRHRLAGVTRYKETFGGYRVEYVEGWELPVRPILFRLLVAMKKRFRGL